MSDLFQDVRALPASERVPALLELAADDPAVRAEVESLLASDVDDGFLESGAAVVPADLLDAAGPPVLAPGGMFGPYRISRLLARGGMGVLYVADDPRLARRVTLKVLPASMARDPRARARLQREARTAALLRHPHIVTVHALEEIERQFVIVAEYVEGVTLASAIARDGPFPRARWLTTARALAVALAAAHDAHVVHRDVKSANVILGNDGVRLIDFGIALGEYAGADTRLTHAGQLTGTPLAFAPEQLEGAAATPLSDQFSFGVLLYEMASGQHPFAGGLVAEVWARVLRDAPAPLSVLAPALWHEDSLLVHRCLLRDPTRRFASMHDVVTELDRLGRARSPSGPSARVAVLQTHEGRRWWDLHQAITTALYVGVLWPAWVAAGVLSGRTRALVLIAIVCLAALATSLRLHLWFSARHYPAGVAAGRRRLWPMLAATDACYALALAATAVLAAEQQLIAAVVLAALAVCLLMASLVIEPATMRALELRDDPPPV